jgi:hypothetical protein
MVWLTSPDERAVGTAQASSSPVLMTAKLWANILPASPCRESSFSAASPEAPICDPRCYDGAAVTILVIKSEIF